MRERKRIRNQTLGFLASESNISGSHRPLLTDEIHFASVGRWFIPLFTGCHLSQVVRSGFQPKKRVHAAGSKPRRGTSATCERKSPPAERRGVRSGTSACMICASLHQNSQLLDVQLFVCVFFFFFLWVFLKLLACH